MMHKTEEPIQPMRPAPFLPHQGRGEELCKLLRSEFNVPEGATAFSVHFRAGDLVRVYCEYIPREDPK